MVWAKKNVNRTYRGWTKDPRYNCQSGRDRSRDESQATDSTSSEHIELAMKERARSIEERTSKNEVAKVRIEESSSTIGQFVRSLTRLIAFNTPVSPKNPNQTIQLFTKSSANYWGNCDLLEEGSVGMYMGSCKMQKYMRIRGKATVVDETIYRYIFGEKVVYFEREALQWLTPT